MSRFRRLGAALGLAALAACSDSPSEPVDPLSLSVDAFVSAPARVIPGEQVSSDVRVEYSSNADVVGVDSVFVVRFVDGDSVSSQKYSSSLFTDVSPHALGSDQEHRVGVRAYVSARRGSEEVSRVADATAQTRSYRMVDVDLLTKTFFDNVSHNDLEVLVRNSTTGEESVYRSEGGRIAFSTVEADELLVTPRAVEGSYLLQELAGEPEELPVLASGDLCVPTSFDRPSWKLSAREDVSGRVYSVSEDTDILSVLARHARPFDSMIDGEVGATKGVVLIPDPRIQHYAVRLMGPFNDPFVSWGWSPDAHSPDPDGLWQRFQSAFEVMQEHPRIPDGCAIPQVEFVDADRDMYVDKFWSGEVANPPITPRSLPGVHSFNRRLESRVSRRLALDEHGNTFLSAGDASSVMAHLGQVPSEHTLMGVREPNLVDPFRCIYGNKMDISLVDDYAAHCFDRDNFLAPRSAVADPYVVDLAEDETRAWLVARVFGHGYYDAYESHWRPVSRDHPVWEELFRPRASVGAEFSQQDSELYTPLSSTRAVGLDSTPFSVKMRHEH